MKGLIITLKQQVNMRIDMSPLTPNELYAKKLADIRKIKLWSGNKRYLLSSLFDIRGQSRAKCITIRNSSSKLDFIGHGMTFGDIKVNGSVGDYLGQNMKGGNIFISGNAGQWVGNCMKDGNIEIKKNVADHLGAALPGERHGLLGGIIHVHGRAGARIGDRMRRGVIVIEGDGGDYCGYRMLAGTIVVLGKVGKYLGFAMQRGSIILNNRPAAMLPTFNDCGNFDFHFMRIIFNELIKMNKKLKFLSTLSLSANRISGDLAVAGKGEILILYHGTRA